MTTLLSIAQKKFHTLIGIFCKDDFDSHSWVSIHSKKVSGRFKQTYLNVFILFCLFIQAYPVLALDVQQDNNCTTQCCSPGQPCNCTAGVKVFQAVGPVTVNVYGPGNTGPLVGTTLCVTGLCPGTYYFEVRDLTPQVVVFPVTVGGQCCKLLCRDTVICYSIPDSAIHLVPPSYADTSSNGGGAGGGNVPCVFDSIWNNSPGVFPVGTTVVTWYVHTPNGIDSCTQNVIRNPPSPYTLCFNTTPPVVGGVINICNGQSITFNANCSTGISGLLWNFGNGYYSSNSVHTEPASHYPPGTYYDTLTVFDDCGLPHDTAFMVVVDTASGPDIFCISVVCPGDTVTYHTNANCTTYNWAVSGGTFYPVPPNTSDSATVIWGPGPNGTISLSVSGCTPPLNCPIATVKNVKIVPATLPVEGDTIVCAGSISTYCIECIPGNSHSWEMLPANAGTITGQGTCCITIQWNPTFTGTVTIQVNYNNILTGSGCSLPEGCTHDPGCGGYGLLHIQVRPVFGISGPSKVCPNTISAPFNGMNTTLNTIEPNTAWKVVTPVPSTLTFGTTALFNAYTWNAGVGIYTVTAYAPPNIYCNDSATVKVEVVEIKNPGIISGPDTVCAGVTTFYTVTPNMSGVSYNWTVTGGTLIPPLNGSSIGVQWSPGGGTLSVTQQLTASPFCVSTSSPVFVVKTWPNFPLPTITPSGPIACVNSTITYSFPGPLISNGTYTWSVIPATAGNILTANGTNTITIKWVDNSITPIFVKLKINRCYDDSVKVPVTLFSLPPVPNISYSPLDPCINNPVNFTTSSSPTWNWSFGDAGTSTLQNPVHTYTSSGNFNVVLYVTNPQGCSDTAKTTIHVDDKPVVPNIAGPNSVCLNTYSTYTFPEPLYPGAAYTWSLSVVPKGTIINQSSNSLYLKWTTPGIDTVKVHVQSTCLDTVIKFPVTINALPVAGITVPSPACEGTALSFNGTGGVSYSWLFTGGSPSSSNVASPVVTYPTKGNYGVYLTVTDANGCIGTKSITVTINPKPLAFITGPAQICAYPATITLKAVDAAGYTFAWSPSGSGPTITPTINAATTFYCVVTNAYGCTRTSNLVFVDTTSCPPPDTGIICIAPDTINFTSAPPVCLSDVFTKTGTATLTGWNFGDGGSAGPTSPVSHTYAFPGIYLVTVQGTAPGLDINGMPCVKNVSKSKFITIPFDARFDFSFQCNGANQMQTVITNTSLYLDNASNYTWSWLDNGNPFSSNPFPPPVTLTPSGPHVVTLAIFDPITLATCTLNQTVNVPTPIVANYSVSTPVCQNYPATFTDLSVNIANEVSRLFTAYPSGPTTTFSPDSMIYTSTGLFTSSLTVTDIYGCTSTATQPVNVLPGAVGTITVSPNNCDSVQLTAGPGAGPFTWVVVSPPPVPDNPIYVKNSGYYKVVGIAPNGCKFTAGPVYVTVKQSPVATITGPTQYCQGEKLNIKTSAAGSSIVWNQLAPTFISNVGNTANLTIIPSPTGFHTYEVVVTGLNGCIGTATYTIYVDPVPAAASIVASGPTTFCDGDSVILTVNPAAATYLWSKSPTPPLSSPADTNDSLFVKVSGTYSVIASTPNGCPYPAINPVTVTVNPNPPAKISGDTVVCEGETLALQTVPAGGATFSWTGPGGAQVTNPYVKTNMQLSDAGVYTVVVTYTATGCTSSASVTVVVNPAPVTPVVTSNPGGVLCEGQLYVLTAGPPPIFPVVYTWSTGQLGASINAVMPGNYYVTASNQFGCTSVSNVITIHPLPDLSCVPSGCYDFCEDCNSVTIPGPAGFASYTWQQLVGVNWTFYSATQNLIVFPPGGKYRLLAANQWGCSDSSDVLDIMFHTCCPPVDTTICKDTCITFNDNNLHGFMPNPSAPNVLVSLSNVGSQGGAADYYVLAQDQPGPSQLLGSTLLNGKWCCGTFCFDFKMFEDATFSNVNPSFQIRSGTYGFIFVSTVVANATNGWHSVCAPITDCNPPPSSPLGTWTPIAGTTTAQWTSVLSNITEVIFKVDYTAATDESIGIDNVCLNSDVPDIDAGPDDTICAGQYATLHVTGCTGVPQWFEIGTEGNIFLLAGEIVDVNPQQTTCYMVTCCNEGACCCDTDTVCIIVNPLPVLQWPITFTNVCQNSAPVFLDASSILVFVNPNWVPVTSTTGTGIFSGPGVAGNYFYPTTLGTYTITYTYTDPNGCTASVTNTITVIDCPPPCDNGPSCQINAGPDQTICAGQPAILNVQNCNSIASWFAIGAQGNVFVGTGQTIDVFPHQSTCYIVICCNPPPCCCDTDTVCINVNPLPVLQWPIVYSNVCLNSAPIFLDASNILVFVNPNWVPVTSTTGSGFFSGINVTGNFFNPVSLGTFTITYTYTDPNGCVNTITNVITVINCCNQSAACQIDAGPDQTICHGQPAILTVQNCNSIPHWYSLGENEPVFVGEGPVLDVFPPTTTCYIVICCNPAPCCCDTDTVCITVNQLPILQWPTVYANVCLNSSPIFLNASNILVYVNPNWVPVTSTGGTGFFSGPGVAGNYFYPSTLGSHVITYTYTDPNGCTSTITNTITVIDCGGCDNGPNCQIDAGPDQTICAGQPAILHVNNCNSQASWFQLKSTSIGNELFFIGGGQDLDVFPQQNTCYVVVCCNPPPCCCDTDTVCITVNPVPILQWQLSYAPVCVNSAPIFLDASNIFVFINPNWVPVTSTAGTGFFSGPGVAGNFFYPSTIGTHVITYYYTDPNGCTASITTSITVIDCGLGCDNGPNCQIDAGPDQIICQGQPAILSVQGCNSTPSWFAIGDGANMFVGTGQFIDVIPQHSTCYMVICCNPPPCCCDTDTVCITVRPAPILQWPLSYSTVCLNSAPIFLDANNIFVYINNLWVSVTASGGTGFFSGPGVAGNYFYPTTLGTHVITYYYTDEFGCTSSITNTITVIDCGGCDNGPDCQVSAGPDQTICFGQPAILSVQGCNSTASWFQIGQGGAVGGGENIFVGTGETIDVFPQGTTCYMVICCNPPPCCCDTDTVCITVNPLPFLQWPFVYNQVCLNSAPVFLDASNILVYVNPNFVPVTSTAGTGFFSGPNVAGNYFYPNTVGTFTITYTYTDENGCTSSISNTITVIDCGSGCDNGPNCQINAGPDQTICIGQAAILQVQNCNSQAVWLQIGPEGNTYVGSGQILDVFPQHSACYMVVCCNPPPCCCDTDTVCITVNPLPVLQWPLSYNNVCLNAAPISLDASNIFVFINNAWVSVVNAGGSGFFSGPGVVGNLFYPSTLGVQTITYYYTDANGCTGSVTNTINVISCGCDPVVCNCNSDPPPPLPTITINSVDPDNCHNDGCIHATFTGCCLLYSYTYYDPCRPELSYSIAQTNNPNIFCNLKAGTYTIYVQDICGNLVQTNVVVPLANGPLNVSVNFTSCGGEVCATAEGGCPPYIYSWANGSTSQCISGEPCTETWVTVTDSRGCTYTKFIVIPGITFTNVVRPSCCLPNGRMCAVVCFGPKPYTYQWNTPIGQTTACISGLTPGLYCLTVTNALGQQIQCCYNLVAQPIVPPTVSFVFNNCGSTVTAVLGEGNCPGYTYHWDNNSTELVRSNIEYCDSLTFTVVTCDGAVYHHGIRVPRTYPTITPVNCLTNIGAICVPVDCFRCEPYTYTWYPAPVSIVGNGSCVTAHPGIYTVCITNSCGDVICCRVYLPPPLITDCNVIIHVNVWIQGFYSGGGLMDNGGNGGPLHVSGVSPDLTDADTIFVSAVTSQPPYTVVDRQPGILKTNGDVAVTFGPGVIAGNSYYIKLNHRNAIETWSASPVVFSQSLTYDFTTNASQAFGNNQTLTPDNMGWAIFSGDINQDGSIDGSDFLELDPSIQNGDGGYVVGDLNGDGAVDGTDFLVLDPNVQSGIGISIP